MSKVFILLIIASIASVVLADPNYCYATDPIRPMLNRFSERTAYDTIRGTFNPAASSCTPTKFWFYTRHAARLPGVNDIGRMQNIRTQVNNIIAAGNAGRGTLCQQDFNLISAWQFDPNITVAIEQYLTVAGWNEAMGIANRYQRAYPTLLQGSYNRNQFTFRNTNRQRTQATIRAFMDGLWGRDAYQQVFVEPVPEPDRLLRPHDGCPLYDAASDNTVQRTAWQNGAQFQRMMSLVNDKLGLTGNQRLTARQVRTLWDICNFEQLWDMSRPAPFCGAFSFEDNLMLEYFEDLDFYYNSGFGGPRRLFENMNCPLIQDMLDFLENDIGQERVRVYGTHSTAFQLFLVTLGVFGNDQPLTAANFAQQANREWKSSLISPMATNIAVVRYSCGAGNDDDIMFLINEQPMVIPGCQTNGICKSSFLRQRYQRFIGANCNSLACSNL